MRISTLALLMIAPIAIAEPVARGQITIDGKASDIVDAVAMPFMGSWTKVALRTAAFDRARMAEDGRLDFADLMSAQGRDGAVMIEFRLASPGDGTCIDVSPASPKTYCDGVVVELTTRTADRVAGTLTWKGGTNSAQASFDVPIQDTLAPVVRGTPLPADGGEPGRAMLALFDAIAAGDVERIRAQSHPSQRKEVEMTDPTELATSLRMMKAMTPTKVTLDGGSVDGDEAWINFSGQLRDKDTKGSATLERLDGRWYVKGLRSRRS